MEVTEVGTLASQTRGDRGAPRDVGELRSGDQVGRYVVLNAIGTGGMGVVYAAYDPELDRRVAIKVLRERLGGQGPAQRLQREARAMARLSHPNIVVVHDVGTLAGRLFVAMEFVRGQTLRAWLASGSRSTDEILAAYRDAGTGLAVAHGAGLVHRDFKPDNAMIDELGRVRVLDFGLAVTLEGAAAGRGLPEGFTGGSSRAVDAGTILTQSVAALAGTPAYLAPELFRGGQPTPASDQFAFCVALYEALYGERPFAGTNMAELSLAVTGGELRPPSDTRELPERLRRALLRGLATEPAKRWPSMAELLAALAPEAPAPTRRLGAAALLGSGLLAASIVAVAWSADDEPAPRCREGEQQLAGTWDRARRAELGETLAGTQTVLGPELWPFLAARLDAWAELWMAVDSAACLGRDGLPEQLRVAQARCLAGRKREFEALVEVLAQADPQVLATAVEATAELPSPLRCGDAELLAAAVEPPASPEQQAESDAIAARLAKVEAFARAGKYAAAVALAEPALADAEALGYAPTLARAELARGSLEVERGDYSEGAELLERGFARALAAGDDERANDAARRLVRLYGASLAKPEQARAWELVAEGLTARDPDPAGAFELAVALATVAGQRGEFEAARAGFERALELWQALPAGDPVRRATALNNLAIYEFRLGRLELAEAHFGEVHTAFTETYGRQHPRVATALTNLGNVALAAADYAGAQPHFEAAEAIWSRTVGPEHPDLAAAVIGLAAVHTRLGAYDQALAAFERAHAIQSAALGPEHAQLGYTLANHGGVLVDLGRYGEARSKLEQARTVWEAAMGPEHALLAVPLAQLAEVELAEGALELAGERAARAVELGRQFGSDNPKFASVRLTAGKVALARGRLDEARTDIEAAHALFAASGAEPGMRARSELALAELRVREGQPETGRELVERALGRLSGPADARLQAQLREWLAAH